MTNAEKYLKDGVDSRYFATALYKFILQGSNTSEENSILGYINTFLDLPVQPTLTEDERAILRNIDNRYTHIQKDNGLWIVNHADEYESELLTFEEYDHLFQFIKEGEEYPIEELLKDDL